MTSILPVQFIIGDVQDQVLDAYNVAKAVGII